MRRKHYYLLLYIFFLLWATHTNAQSNRREIRSSNLYQSNYQRINTCASSYHSFEIRNGSLWAYGFNAVGQLGDSTNIQRNEPVQIGVENNWVVVAAGYWHSVGIKSNGTLWACGWNNEGRLGDGTFTNAIRMMMAQIGTDSSWVSVVTGENHTLALKADGTLWAWGSNVYGQLGDGSLVNKNVPVQIGTEHNWTAVSAGRSHSLALKADGSLWAWGDNEFGQCGFFSPSYSTVPLRVGTDNSWVKISAGYTYSLGLKANGSLWSWGQNSSFALGNGISSNKSNPVQIGIGSIWKCMSAGKNHGAAIKSNGTLWLWGTNLNGELASPTYIEMPVPTQFGTENNWVNVSLGTGHTMAEKADGTIWTWGRGDYGQTGNGSISNQTNPLLISTTKSSWLTTTLGLNHTLGIKTDGSLWAWGRNSYGQLGIANLIDKNQPVKVDSGNNWVNVAAGGNHSLAIKASGTLWAWGQNSYGELGVGNNATSNIPIQIGTDDKWASIACGDYHNIAIKADGTLWAWGYNSSGQLGDSSVIAKNVPIQVGTDSNWVSVSVGLLHTIGLKANGTIFIWGNNSFSQLGNGSSNNSLVPTQITTNSNWISINAGDYYNCALKADGTLWGWGFNANGQLGLNDSTNRNIPTQVGTDNKWILISSGGYHNIALKANGAVYSWGFNGSGELGLGNYFNKYAPAKVNVHNNIAHLSTGASHTVIVNTTRKQFCASGLNTYGQLGDNTLQNKINFTCVDACIRPLQPVVSNKNICEGFSTKLVAEGAGFITWYSDSVMGTILENGSSYTTPVLQKSAVYYVQDSTCAASLSRSAVYVNVNAKLKAGFTINNDRQCINGNRFLFADTSVTNQNTKRLWYLGNNDTSTLQTVGKTYPIPDLYTVKLVVTDSVCVDSVSKTVNVLASPSAGFIINNEKQCLRTNNFLYTDTSKIDSGLLSRQWNFGDESINFNTDSIANKKYTSANNFWVRLKVTGQNTCADSISKKVTVFHNPVVTATASQNKVCLGDKITLNGTGALTYVWSDQISNGVSFVPVESKMYRVIGTDSNQCADSANISITVNALPDVSTTLNKTMISANLSGATYQWINCNAGNSLIMGATNRIYTPVVNGNYAVIVTLNNCSDTSTCVTVNSIGINDIVKSTIQLLVYPNPAKDILHIEVNNKLTDLQLNVFDMNGKFLKNIIMADDSKIELQLNEWSAGMYILYALSNEGTFTYKFIKQ